MGSRVFRNALCASALGLMLALQGCAGSVETWIANTRVNQGNVALDRGNLQDAETAYRLALKVSPHDPRAQAGFSKVAIALAQVDYRKGDFDDALTTLDQAQKYDPQSVRLQALRSQIDDARLKRQIVISNYPTYEKVGLQLQDAYTTLNEQNRAVLKSLKRFNYTYDTQDLTRAIRDSYELELDVAKNTNRLIAYRQLVESGVPSTEKSETAAPTGSLLPLP